MSNTRNTYDKKIRQIYINVICCMLNAFKDEWKNDYGIDAHCLEETLNITNKIGSVALACNDY